MVETTHILTFCRNANNATFVLQGLRNSWKGHHNIMLYASFVGLTFLYNFE